MSGVGEAAAAIAIVNFGLQVSKHVLRYGIEVYGASDAANNIHVEVQHICLYFEALNELRRYRTSNSSIKVDTFMLMFFKECDLCLKALWKALLTACNMPVDTEIDNAVVKISGCRRLLWPCNKGRLHKSLSYLKELKNDAFKILLLLGLLQQPRSGFVAKFTAGMGRNTKIIAQLWSELKIKYWPGTERREVQSLDDLQFLASRGPQFSLRATSEDKKAEYIRGTAETDFQTLVESEEKKSSRLTQSQHDQALDEVNADGVEGSADGDNLQGS